MSRRIRRARIASRFEDLAFKDLHHAEKPQDHRSPLRNFAGGSPWRAAIFAALAGLCAKFAEFFGKEACKSNFGW
jgi:hypothetical protein